MPSLHSLHLLWHYASTASEYLSRQSSLVRQVATWLSRLSPLPSSPPRLSRQRWRRERISNLMPRMHRHRRQHPSTPKMPRLHRKPSLGGPRVPRSHTINCVRRSACREQSSTSGVVSWPYARMCTARLLAYFVTHIRRNPKKGTANSGEAK